jgi:threonine dehydrogenase-like Zn-dependent dehydrogenase/sugar phosphate isomerase/epimerase
MRTTPLIVGSDFNVGDDSTRVQTTIATVTLGGTLEDKLAAVAAAGFDGIELWEPDLEASTLTPQQVRARCDDLGLSIDAYQPFRDFDSIDASRFSANLRRAEAKFDIMTALGAKKLLVVSAVSSDAVREDHLLVEQLRTLADRADLHQIKVAYEALGWGKHVNTWDHSWAIVAKADHPALGLCLDSFHILTRTSEPVGIDEIDPEKLFVLQLADAPPLMTTDVMAPDDVMALSRHHRLFPGQGAFDLPDFLRHLFKAGYTGPVSLEVFNDRFQQADPERIAVDAQRSLLALVLSASSVGTPSSTNGNANRSITGHVDKSAGDVMRAVVLRPPLEEPGLEPRIGRIAITDLPIPRPGPTEVLVRVQACGICGTDTDACRFHADNGPTFGGPIALPVVLGHEAAGVVTEIGDHVTRVKPGELVALESVLSCGVCDTCLLGRRNQCENLRLAGLTAPGALAEYIVVPQTACYSLIPLLDAGASANDALLAGCLLEPLGCVYNALFVNSHGLRPGDRVSVHGLGPLGLFAGMLAAIAGAAKVVGVDPVAERRAFAARLGFDLCLPPPVDTAHPTRIPDLVADVHIETSGHPDATLPIIERLLLPGSRCLLVSRTNLPATIDTNPWVSSAAQLICSRGHCGGIFPNLIRLFAAGRLRPDDLIGAVVSLEDIPQLLAAGLDETPGKTVVMLSNSTECLQTSKSRATASI